MRIVFEGADLVGKSTLAQEVAKRLNLPYRGKIVRVSPEELLLKQQEDFKKHPEAVLDRCYWLSNLIYEPITAHAPSIISTGNALRDFLRDPDTVYVLVTANEATLGARYKERGDELQTLSTIIEANKMYLKVLQVRTPKNLIILHTDKLTVEQSVDKVMDMLKQYLGEDVAQQPVKKEVKPKQSVKEDKTDAAN